MYKAVHAGEAAHQSVFTGVSNQALLMLDQGKHAEAAALLRRAVDIATKLHGEGHGMVALRTYNLGQVLAKQGKFAEAEPVAQQAVAIWK